MQLKFRDNILYTICAVFLLILPSIVFAGDSIENEPSLVIAYSADIRGNLKCVG